MKSSSIVLIASLLSVSAFAQGRVSFSNDSLHMVYWGPTAGLYYGQPVNSDTIPLSFGLTGLAADLYMGTASDQLYLYASTTFRTAAAGLGLWNIVNLVLNANPTTGAPELLPGTTVFVEVGVRSTEKAPGNIFDAAALQTFQAHGKSVEFTYLVPSGITYPPLWSPTLGTWPPGTFNMDQYGLGFRGAIQVDLIPEPSTFALAGLGAAAMLTSRRRK
jgi:hypothetical protein